MAVDSSTGLPAPAVPRQRPWLVLAVLCLGFFVILLDTTIVNIAVPELTVSLGATLDQVLWIVNAYTITYAALLITGGRLGDMYGAKRLFMIGLVLFTTASAVCGLAQTPAQLIAARALQGVGGALLTPQTLAIITVTFPANRRGAAYGIWGAVAGLATVAGPAVGGWLVTSLNWRWVFYVNLPIGLAALGLAAAFLPDLRFNRRHRLDWRGTALVSLALFLISFGLIEGPSHRWGAVWGPVTIPTVLGAGVVVLLLFVWQQRAHRDREPLVPTGIYANRDFAVMSGVVAAISFGMLGLFLPLVIFLQSVLSLSALQAGLVLAPMSLASIASAPVAGRLADRYGGKDALIFGLVFWAGGIALVLWSTRIDDDRGQLIAGLVIAGLGLGMTFAPLQSIAMRDIMPNVASAAAGLMNTARQLGALLGSSVTGALLQAQLAARLGPAADQNVDALPESFRPWVLDGFHKAAATAKGLEVGAGQSGAHIPADVPASVRPAIEQIALKAFHESYIPAMRLTLILPVIVLALAVIGALFVRHTGRPRTGEERTPTG
ncbi:MFS transporter [Actinocrispum wychmicini]|uniref:EmrB/QacA subfamily drug resistance transporter n=1 Tax=Actinocrispum wychmicini TaxID=1213861 RepID=A0A4R2K0X3_9PSEU|nr:MFS transporter [Actinocrispum wychmicini]TCO65934.1 EmrB/QacA subfamily drug resistance transporter [Actinocrispum wychmicini]